MSNDWYPANHTYTGDTDGRPVKPHYLTMPDRIRVWDPAVRTQGWTRFQRKLWRQARTAALSRWGYPFEVVEKKNPAVYLPEGITLRPFTPNPEYGKNSYGGFGLEPILHPETSDYDEYAWNMGKGFALIYPTVVTNAFAARVTGVLTGTMGHEIGHALGFGHGGTGIMESVLNPPYYPNLEELNALEAYWGRA